MGGLKVSRDDFIIVKIVSGVEDTREHCFFVMCRQKSGTRNRFSEVSSRAKYEMFNVGSKKK